MVRAMLVCATAIFALSCAKVNVVEGIKADGMAQVAATAPSSADRTDPRVQKLRDLAEQGDVKARLSLGQAFEQGLGVQKDPVEAVRWYRLAAAQGDPSALFHLGAKFFAGADLAKDEREALWHWTLAAEQGFAPAQAALGKVLSTGSEEIVIDKVKAYLWLSLASAQGEKEAGQRLAVLAKRLQPLQIAEARTLLQRWKPARMISVVRSVSK